MQEYDTTQQNTALALIAGVTLKVLDSCSLPCLPARWRLLLS